MSANKLLHIPETSTKAGCDFHRPKTSDAMAMQVYLTDIMQGDLTELPSSPTHVVRLNHHGIRFNHCEELDCSQRIWLRMRLDQCVTVTAAEVTQSLSVKDHTGKKCFDTQVRFVDTSSEFKSLIQSHIDNVIAKLFRNRREYDYVPGGLSHNAA